MYDIITIGSATLDIFIKTAGEIRKHESHLDLCYHLGNKLLVSDIIFSSGGGGTNTAVAFSRLGLKTAFLGVVGADEQGELILRELESENVEFIGKVKREKTGMSIILPGKEDRTILSYKGANNYLDSADIPHEILKTKAIYISTMLGKSLHTIQNISFLAKKKKILIALNISEYLAKKGLKALSKLLEKTDVVILNREEASVLTKKKKAGDALIAISNYCPGIIVITDSFKPIHAYYDGNTYKKIIKKVIPIDKTGAGDAFASGFVYGFLLGKEIETCLEYGHLESIAVMKHIGAKNNLLRSL